MAVFVAVDFAAVGQEFLRLLGHAGGSDVRHQTDTHLSMPMRLRRQSRNIDVAMLRKIYGNRSANTPERTYSPAVYAGIEKIIACGPDVLALDWLRC